MKQVISSNKSAFQFNQAPTSERQEPRIAEFEELVLLAISGLHESAYGAAIGQRLEYAGRQVAVGALYTTLKRLERKGMIASTLGEATAARGGKAKTYYVLTPVGQGTFEVAERVRKFLRPSPFAEGADVGKAFAAEPPIALLPVGDRPEPRTNSVESDSLVPSRPSSVPQLPVVASPQSAPAPETPATPIPS